MKSHNKKTQRKRSKKIQNSPQPTSVVGNNSHQSSIVRKIRNVCDKIARSSSNVFDFDTYLLSRLKYLFNTNRHLVNVNKYFRRKKRSSDNKDAPLEVSSSPQNVEGTPDKNYKNISQIAKLNTIKSLRDVTKLDEILERHHRNQDHASDEFVYKLSSYARNARTVAAQLWHWKVLDCVRKSKVSFHNFFLHTIGAAIKKMTDDEIMSFVKIAKDTALLRLDEDQYFESAIDGNGEALRNYYLKLLHSCHYLIHHFNQALFSWYTMSFFTAPNEI